MIVELRKIDALIVISLIIVAIFVLYSAGYIEIQEDEPVIPIITTPEEPEDTTDTPTPPTSPLIMGYMRSVTPEDEGKHFHKLRICREWWYYTAIFSEDSDLAGWTMHVSFNHMAWGDLFGTFKPDVLVVTLHGPNGEEYGGIINKERGLGLLKTPTLEADTPGVSVKYGKSWVEGLSPEWHLHVEDEDVDKDHTIIIDLDYFAPSDPMWTFGSRAFQKSKSTLASYSFMGCNITGTIEIDGDRYVVKGTGHHEHTWTPNAVVRGTVKEWDWSQIQFDNGWSIYYSNYKIRHKLVDNKENRFNPLGTVLLTTNGGQDFTILDGIETIIGKSENFEDKIFLHVKMPNTIDISAKPSLLQPLIKQFNIELDLEIKVANTYEKVWKIPTYLGMKLGRSQVTGKMSWVDGDNNAQEVELNGVATSWNMRALI